MEQHDTPVLEREQPQVVVRPQPTQKQEQTPDTNPDMRILFEAFRL